MFILLEELVVVVVVVAKRCAFDLLECVCCLSAALRRRVLTLH